MSDSSPRMFDLYGFKVCSPIPLGAPVAGAAGAPDLEVAVGGEREIPGTVPEGELLAHYPLPGGWGFAHVETPHGFLLRYFGTCEFLIDRSLARLVAFTAPGAVMETVGLLLAGNALSVWICLKGECFLHASAVEIDGRAVAFVGHTGAGKSTFAAACCLHGCPVVADDLLRLDLGSSPVRCFPGLSELRLRTNAGERLSPEWKVDSRQTSDGRNAVRPPQRVAEPLPLGALFMPRRRDSRPSLHIEPLDRRTALFELSAFPEAGGWKSRRRLERHFEQMARLVERVPVLRISASWENLRRADFPHRLGTAILHAREDVDILQ